MIGAATTWLSEWLLVGLIHGTVLAGMTWLMLATVLRTARPALASALWTVVLIKFLIPIGPGSSWSLASMVERLLPAAEPAVGVGGMVAVTEAARAAPAQASGPSLWLSAALLVWAIGAAALAVLAFGRIRALRRRVSALPTLSPADQLQLDELARRAGLRRAPRARREPGGRSPFVTGLCRPVLVVPDWLDLAQPTGRAAIFHEIGHLRRRDLWFAAVETAASIVFWFWPVVTVVRARLAGAREMACDAWAVERANIAPGQLAAYLLEVARRQPAASSVEPAVALVPRQGHLARRIDGLLGPSAPARLGWRLRAGMLAWVAVALTGAASGASPGRAEAIECTIDPGVIAQILASHPRADLDGDGVLSRDEACAHQRRMVERLIDEVVDDELISRMDPSIDIDGDGWISPDELDIAKRQMDVSVADRGLVVEYGMSIAAAVPDEVFVTKADTQAPICRPNSCSAETTPGKRAPFLIDVQAKSSPPNQQE